MSQRKKTGKANQHELWGLPQKVTTLKGVIYVWEKDGYVNPLTEERLTAAFIKIHWGYFLPLPGQQLFLKV